MPKQGQFAKSVRQKHLNNFKVKRSVGKGNAIPDDQLTDYLVVRFALTAKKRVANSAQEAVQRFLIEIADHLLDYQGDLTKIIPQVVGKLNGQVPWQFFAQVDENWTLLEKFLVKELPAVPLAKQCRITGRVSNAALRQMIANALATKGAATTLLNQRVDRAKQQITQALLVTLYHDGRIDWSRVRGLFAPFPYAPDPTLDPATRDWLTKLSCE